MSEVTGNDCLSRNSWRNGDDDDDNQRYIDDDTNNDNLLSKI